MSTPPKRPRSNLVAIPGNTDSQKNIPRFYGADALQKSIDRMLTEAASRMALGKTLEASRSFNKAAQFAEQLLEVLEDPEERRSMALRVNEYRSRAHALARGRLDLKRSRPYEEHETDDQVYTDEESDALEQQILMLIDDRPRHMDWAAIGGMEELKTELKFHYGLAMAQLPPGIEIEGWQNIMFYGPPGTGKTLLACAIANKLNATFFNVKASQVVSKWVGESARLISTLYRLARKFTREGRPSIVFIDEFDALCKSRNSDGQLHHQQMLASILSEIDGFASKGERNMVMTIGATNRPWDLDTAVLSRFERRVLIDLPDRDAREAIFRIHLDAKGIAVDEDSITYEELADMTADLSGREIARFCKEVTAAMLHEMNPRIPTLVDEGLQAIKDYTIGLRPLTRSDFEPFADVTVPDTTPADALRYARWGRAVNDSEAM
ncbi:MAG: hypothetical protein CMM50_16790 [Rhodospirillaceae bacterium]|nr:hypothetical protein [Rhodospirillaceae bacterium]